jgi:DTW domain-containing protein YfiP
VHPEEMNSTIGTAWILRRSISNLKWIRSAGDELDQDPGFLKLIHSDEYAPLLLFPGSGVLNLNHASKQQWQDIASESRRPLLIVIDGTWTQARGILRKSEILRALPRVSFETEKPSEYEFKRQPHPACLSSVEGVHRVIEVLASRGFAPLPLSREHDQMITIFRQMVQFQLSQELSRKIPVAPA